MSASTDVRLSPRRSAFFSATIEHGANRYQVRVRDHSATGCRVQTDEPLGAGDRIVLERGPYRIPGAIAWRRLGLAGIQFDAPAPSDLFQKPAHTEPAPSPTVAGLDQRGRFRRSSLRLESLTTEEAERASIWARGSGLRGGYHT